MQVVQVQKQSAGDLIRSSTYDLVAVAIEQAKRGNVAILNKLLDKVIPSMNLNVDMQAFNPDKEMQEIIRRAKEIEEIPDYIEGEDDSD